jgi:hypothetical protein
MHRLSSHIFTRYERTMANDMPQESGSGGYEMDANLLPNCLDSLDVIFS